MTAEIAILNKSAVALAADSAVSIGREPNLKIYNTVNKIFELSKHNPVGIMIYGGLNFMGLPFETIIKQYRGQLGHGAFDTIEQYAQNFKKYISKSVSFSQNDDRENILFIIFDELSRLEQDIDKAIMDDILANNIYKKSKINGIAQLHIKTKLDDLKSKPYAPGFNKKTIPAQYEPLVEALIKEVFARNRPTQQTVKLLKDFVGCFLSKNVLSEGRTGIVVSGFGTKEICPSIFQFEIDGIVDGKLKYTDFPYIDIGRAGPHADIIGFAQDDMMKSFLNGVDPKIYKYMSQMIEGSVRDTSDMILKAAYPDPAIENQARQALKPQLDALSVDTKQKIDEYIRVKASDPIRQMIRSMPKQELAILASSLIEITSLKRKVTRTQETVGGDVDVAIISKADGFVWVKRKHYFPPELNRRFFVRNFGV